MPDWLGALVLTLLGVDLVLAVLSNEHEQYKTLLGVMFTVTAVVVFVPALFQVLIGGLT